MSDTTVNINETSTIRLYAAVALCGSIAGALVWHLIFILGVSAKADTALAQSTQNKSQVDTLLQTQTAMLVELAGMRVSLKHLEDKK